MMNLFSKAGQQAQAGVKAGASKMVGLGNKVMNTKGPTPPPKPKASTRKKGEVTELLEQLNKLDNQRNPPKMRSLLRKVIQIMTMGFDVSSLFTSIVNAAVSKDMIIKKSCYLYLAATAKQNEELSVLAINTFLKDMYLFILLYNMHSQDEDPKIRGLALRTLTSLRVPTVIEYMMQPLTKCLTDQSSYVRKAAVLGLLKCFHIDQNVVLESGMLETIPDFLVDDYPEVVVNAIHVIRELNIEFDITSDIIHPLLNRLGEFNEWGLCAVLSLLYLYTPADPDETFTIMNLLEPVFRQHNTAVILGTVKCYLKFTRDIPEILPQVYLVIKEPMLTLMNNPSYEIAYAVLSHLKWMLRRDSSTFQEDYKQFYIRYNEPSTIQQKKIEILPLLMNDQNESDILLELSEYIVGTPENVSRAAIKSISLMGLSNEEMSDIVIEALMDYLSLDIDYIRSEIICCFQDLVRKYPIQAPTIIPTLPNYLRKLEDENGKSACIWLFGEYPKLAFEAPYIIEGIIDNYDLIKSISLKQELLTSTIKLFFERSPEVYKMLIRLFKAVFNDKSDPNFHDRATVYYKLLEKDVENAKKIIYYDPNKKSFNERDTELEESLFDEFDTLSIIYNKHSHNFITSDEEFEVPEVAFESEEEASEDDGTNIRSESVADEEFM